MGIGTWITLINLVLAFLVGATAVHRLSRRFGRAASGPPARAVASTSPTAARPRQQMHIRGFDGLVEATQTEQLIASIERRTRLSAATYERDCRPVLESFAEFVQMLPASECHHHAQPGGLWIHALEVLDAALTFRAGMEIPPAASTEERKSQEHRWTYAVFAAALLHDVGKPVTDVVVTLYGEDPRSGRAWAPMAGSMRSFGATWYSVAFGEPSQRDYQAHQKLPAMLLQSFVPARVLRWLAEEGDALPQLLSYLSGDDANGLLGAIIKRADSDSVRRNLLQGPRTRFASARTTPLIERLMEALRRMLREGAALPLNRPGAAGWVHDGKVYFVCKRLADEVRAYLAKNESASALPGPDRNDRLFDTWQEYGAALPAPDGGAVWTVRVECDGWSPAPLTVLCFPLDALFASPTEYPPAMNGRVTDASQPGAAALSNAAPVAAVAPAAATRTAAPAAAPAPVAGAAAPAAPAAPAASTAPAAGSAGAPVEPQRPLRAPEAVQAPPTAPVEPTEDELLLQAEEFVRIQGPAVGQLQQALGIGWNRAARLIETLKARGIQAAATAGLPDGPVAPPGAPIEPPQAAQLVPAPVADNPAPLPAAGAVPPGATGIAADDTLSAAESAASELAPAQATTTPVLGLPLRPKERGKPPADSSVRLPKGPTPAATAFMAWVAAGVGSGAITYNEEAAPVHFVPEGALLLSPEIFRRFVAEHAQLQEGPIAELVASKGEKAFARLQNELAKSGWTVRNGDENVHHYAFVKADKAMSRPASFFLIGRPELFWNPVPAPNERIRRAPRAKRLVAPATAGANVGRSVM